MVPEEQERLRAAQQEMLRLRGEVTLLSRQKLRPWIPTNRVENAEAQPNVQTNISGFERLETTARAQLAQRQTLAIGGWPIHAGYRLLLLATPTIVGDSLDQVDSDVYAIEAPETFLNRYGMGALVLTEGAPAAQAVISEEQRAGFQAALKELFRSQRDAAPNAEGLSHSYEFPPLVTSNGVPISIRSPLIIHRGHWTIGGPGPGEPAPGAPYLAGRFDLGPYTGAPIILAPTIMANNGSIDLSVDAIFFWHPASEP